MGLGANRTRIFRGLGEGTRVILMTSLVSLLSAPYRRVDNGSPRPAALNLTFFPQGRRNDEGSETDQAKSERIRERTYEVEHLALIGKY